MNRNELYHHGIKGQRWGVRRFQNKDGTLTAAGKRRYDDDTNNGSDGHEINFVTKTGAKGKLKKHSQTKLAKFLSTISPSIAEESKKSLFYDIRDDNGKKIGDLQLYKESSTSVNVNWVGVNPKARGNGYASAVMDKAIQIAKKNGATQVTLEVPGNSPDARHIYEKMGFKATKAISGKDDVWSGLTAMKLKLEEDLQLNKNELRHHGIKGQMWGVRRFQNADGTRTAAGKKRYAKSLSDEEKSAIVKRTNIEKAYRKAQVENSRMKPVKEIIDQSQSSVNALKRISDDGIKNGTKKVKFDLSQMSDKEMRDRINRQLLENQYNSLFAPEVSTVTKGQKAVNSMLSYAGTVLTLGSTALGIALTIKSLKKE